MCSTGFFWMAATMPALALSKELWSTQPVGQDGQYILKTGYPVGNGKLGAIPFGPPGVEKVNINIDSLWSGGPFESHDYRGGNPATPKDHFLPEIRAGIFSNGTGDMNQLLGSGDAFGSNRVVANLTVSIAGVETYEKYHRSLDLSNGVHTTSFATGDLGKVETKVFCSYPDQVCVYHIESEENLPAVHLGFENSLVASDLYSTKCQNGLLHHDGVTQKGPPEGMKYTVIAGFNPKQGTSSCLDSGELHIAPTGRKLTIIWSADTNYDQKNGNAEAGFSFKGEDPAARVSQLVDSAIDIGFCALSKRHTDDFEGLFGAFSLQLPDTQGSGSSETSSLIDNYDSKGPGDPFIDGFLFDLSRYLLISSSRQNSLPANLQGRWTEQLWPAWSADYHSNINIQMNYWVADQTGLADTQKALWNYFEDTWVPRGTETAKLLYGAKGWVVHNEMNIFGFTAMKSVASWANYPVAPAWMMQHVWDAFEYTQDVDWFKKQGYPLIKGVAEFWLSSLQEDQYFNDGSLVAVPCNSAEHGPTTFGCTHYQQLIHQVFDSVLAAASIVSEQDGRFLDDVKSSLARLDKGLHFTSWGGIREWKVPESAGVDERSDHRHLSHLNGWYPGYSTASFADGYTNKSIQNAVREALVARGMGNAGDGNAGWAKVWRSACWARLNETERAYDQLKYAIQENFVGNGFSMYSGRNPPFQIDANFGFGGAVLSMLVVDIPLAHDAAGQRTVVVGPAIPKQWANGSVRGLRLRGGGRIDFTWNREGLVEKVEVVQSSTVKGSVQLVNAKGANLGLI